MSLLSTYLNEQGSFRSWVLELWGSMAAWGQCLCVASTLILCLQTGMSVDECDCFCSPECHSLHSTFESMYHLSLTPKDQSAWQIHSWEFWPFAKVCPLTNPWLVVLSTRRRNQAFLRGSALVPDRRIDSQSPLGFRSYLLFRQSKIGQVSWRNHLGETTFWSRRPGFRSGALGCRSWESFNCYYPAGCRCTQYCSG